MKKVIIFIGLKIAEIVGIVFVPYWVGWFIISHRINEFSVIDVFLSWVLGICLILLFGGGCVIIYEIVPVIIKKNWQWAKELSGEK